MFDMREQSAYHPSLLVRFLVLYIVFKHLEENIIGPETRRNFYLSLTYSGTPWVYFRNISLTLEKSRKGKCGKVETKICLQQPIDAPHLTFYQPVEGI